MTKTRTKTILRTITLSITIFSVSFPVYAQYSGGTGEPNDPHQITTAEDLMLLGETPEDYNKHFILTADIDLDPNLPGLKVFDKAVIAPDINEFELDFQGPTFTGVFDGDGHTISSLKTAGKSFLGLFGTLAPDAHVRNLGVLSAHIVGTDEAIGILAGRQSGNMVRCYSTGLAQGSSRVGGLVGHNLTRFNRNQEVQISSCYSTAIVYGNDMIAGLVGENDGTVSECYSIGPVIRNDRARGRAGGLVVAPLKQRRGDYTGTVLNSFWDMETSGQSSSGGGLGCSTIQMQDVNNYHDQGWDFLGADTDGLHDTWQIPDGGGYPVLSIFDGYTPPNLLGTGTPKDPYRITTAAELSAIIYYPRAACYRLENDIDLSGIVWPVAVIPEFSGVFDGNGHVIQNLTVSGFQYLGLFGRLNPGTWIMDLSVVDANITGTYINIGILAGINISGGVTNSYSHGTVDGSGIVGGLVGYNWSNVSFVSNCYSNSTVSGYRNSGGLIGVNAGIIAECCSAGSVNGNNEIGGLIGDNRGSVTNCYSTAMTSGQIGVGGLIGFNDVGYPGGRIENCYSTGTVNGEEKTGGLIGHAEVSVLSGNFWDTQTSGQATNDGGTGKSTDEMQTAATFLEAGWDFMGEMANGTKDIWWILEGKDYPRLWWQWLLVQVVEDFESYNDIPSWEEGSNLIYEMWLVFDNLPPNGAIIGYTFELTMETVIVHTGNQSAPLHYNNTGAFILSEVVRTFTPTQDWIGTGATMLSLWFYGDLANTPGQMYVKINGVKIVYDGDPDDLTRPTWHRWDVDLTAVDADLSNVMTLVIGVDGLGATGSILLDDIELYASAPAE